MEMHPEIHIYKAVLNKDLALTMQKQFDDR
jgi:hypothetical protein